MAAALPIKPEEVYLCSLCHCLVHPPLHNQRTGQPLPPPALTSAKIALFLLRVLKVQRAARFPSLSQLCSMLVAQLGPDLGSEMVQQLEALLQGMATPDDLWNAMEAIWGVLGTEDKAGRTAGHMAGIEPGSVLGVFLRRMRATFLLAPYSSLAATTSALQWDLRRAAEEATTQPPDSTASQPPAPTAGGGGCWPGDRQDGDGSAAAVWGRRPLLGMPGAAVGLAGLPRGSWREPAALMEHLSRQQDRVRQQGEGAMDVAELEALISYLRAHHADVVRAGASAPAGATAWSALLPHAMRAELALALARRDFPRALRALHAQFDHAQAGAMLTAGWEAETASGAGTAGQVGASGAVAGGGGGGGAAVRSRHPASVLWLACLHTHFGHVQEATDALHEAMRAAQQAGDEACLLQVLAQMTHLACATTPGSPGMPVDGPASIKDGGHAMHCHKLIVKCLHRAHELRCPHVAAFARLCLARWHLRFTLAPPAGGGDGGPHATGSDGATAQPPGEGGDEEDRDQEEEEEAAQAPRRPAVLAVTEARLKAEHLAHAAALEAASASCALATAGPTHASGGPHAAGAAAAATSGSLATRAPTVSELYAPLGVLWALPGGAAGAAAGVALGWLGGVSGAGPAVAAAGAAVAAATQQLAASAAVLAAAAWSAVGCPALAHVHAMAYLACSGQHCVREDVEAALAQVLRGVGEQQGPAAASHALAMALKCLYPARALAAATPCQGAAMQGSPETSGAPVTRPLMVAVTAALHQQACWQGRLQDARRLERRMQVEQDVDDRLDAEVELQALLSAVEGALAGEDSARAADLAVACFRRARVTCHPALAERALLVLGRALLAAEQPARALQDVFSCMVHARASHRDGLLAEAGVLQACCWLEVAPYMRRHVLAQLQDALPLVSAHGSLRVRAEAWWLLADALLAHATPDFTCLAPRKGRGQQRRVGGGSGGVGPCSTRAAAGQLRWAAALLEAAAQCYAQLGQGDQAVRAADLLDALHKAATEAAAANVQ